jgi:hypothetical protein
MAVLTSGSSTFNRHAFAPDRKCVRQDTHRTRRRAKVAKETLRAVPVRPSNAHQYQLLFWIPTPTLTPRSRFSFFEAVNLFGPEMHAAVTNRHRQRDVRLAAEADATVTTRV